MSTLRLNIHIDTQHTRIPQITAPNYAYHQHLAQTTGRSGKKKASRLQQFCTNRSYQDLQEKSK